MKSLKVFSNYLVLTIAMLLLSACQTTAVNPGVTAKPKVDAALMKKYQSAVKLMRSGHDDAALPVLQSIVKQEDRLSGPYTNLALIYMKNNNKDKALDALDKALERNPQNIVALNQRAIFHRQAGEFEQAKARYESALKVQSNHANTHLNLGIVCDTYLQDLSCALNHYEKYLAQNGEDADVKNWVLDLKQRM